MKHPPQNIAFELSNRCNYSQAHTRCPNDAKADPIFLKTKIITDIIDYFGRVGLAPGIYVNIYNEPTIDPRLFWIYQYIIEHCDSLIYLFTNGWSINQYMLDEIMKFNVGFVVISVYSDSEEERINKLQGEKLIVQRIILDPLVMQIYDGPPNCHGPCTFPSVYPMINHKGQLGLCCRDYEWREIIADLNEISFEEAMGSGRRIEICDKLLVGERNLDICKRCAFVGWGITQEVWDKWKRENPNL